MRGARAALPAGLGCSNYNLADDSLSTNKLDPRFYLDLAASYVLPWFDDRAEVTLGVNNLTKKDPPPCFSRQLNGFDPNSYEAPGRFGYARLTVHR